MIKKTSAEWFKELEDTYTILDPDGWDRSNFEYSWSKEKITRSEFEGRLVASTIIVKPIKIL